MMQDIEKKRYAVIDLEATEPGNQAKIIQIGIVIIENGQIVQTYDTDINPHEEISESIQSLTGLTNERLAKAPDFGEVAPRIYQLIEDAIFVAHNVRFDANLLSEALFFEGFELRTPRVDTVELAQVFFPTFEKYTLSFLAKQLNLFLQQAHSAMSDAYATAQLLLAIQQKIETLPKDTVEQILDVADVFLFESRLVIEDVYGRMPDTIPSHISRKGELSIRKEEPLLEEGELASDFQENRSRLHLEERQRQEEFVRCIEKNLDKSESVHFIQAQSGIGKTYGYLLALLAKTDKKILVAVPTKILQDQIANKEGKNLFDTFQIETTSIKSPRHYIDLEAFSRSFKQESENNLVARMKLSVLVWLCETKTGDLDELKQKYRLSTYFDRICHRGSVSKDSLFYEVDFFRRLQLRAQKSRILLTNHSYLLHHFSDQLYLMEDRIWVIDEVQKFLLTAESFRESKLDVKHLWQELQLQQLTASSTLEKRLLESCLFEVENWMRMAANASPIFLETSARSQLQQNVTELSPLGPMAVAVKSQFEKYDQFWLEEDKTNQQLYLRASQWDFLNVAALLPPVKLFCISAGLDFGKNLSLSDLLGFKQSTMDFLDIQPEDKQTIFLLEEGIDFEELSLEQQADRIASYLEGFMATGKPILVLFTSVALLQAVADALEEQRIPYLSQYRHGDEGLLKRRFEKGDSQLLLVTGQFWEGVDFSEQQEILQVIPRLPFDNPQDVFVRKMNRYLKVQGKQPFYDYGLPMMLLRLRQAIGRTKRTKHQVSAVILLDKRTQSKKYSKKIRSFLKKQYRVNFLPQKDSIERLSAAFKKTVKRE